MYAEHQLRETPKSIALAVARTFMLSVFMNTIASTKEKGMSINYPKIQPELCDDCGAPIIEDECECEEIDDERLRREDE